MSNIGTFSVKIAATDEGFRRTMDQALHKIAEFKRQGSGGIQLPGAEHTQRVLRDLSGDFLKASRVFGGATRDATKYFGVLSAGFGPVGIAATAAIAAVTALGAGIARAAQASQDLRLTQLQEAERILAEIAGREFTLPRELMTSAQASEELSKSLGRVSEVLMERLVGFNWSQFKLGLADLVESAASWFLGEEALAEIRQRDAMAKQALERARKLKEEAEQRKREAEERRRQEEQEIARIQREMEADVERLKRRGEELAKAVRTPVEVFRDSVRELQQLLSGGFINQETFDRSLREAAEKLRSAEIEARVTPEPRFAAAVQMGTTAEVSARLQAESERARQTQLAEQHLEVSEQILEELRTLNVRVRDGGFAELLEL